MNANLFFGIIIGTVFFLGIFISPIFAQTASAPNAITDLIAVPKDGEIQLSWTAPANNGDTITSYKIIRWETGSDVFTTFPNLSTVTIDGLTNGVSYGFMVLGVNEDGVGPESKIVTATPVGKTPTSSLSIPSWVKNNAKWWAEGKISDLDYVQGIEYLINQGIIRIK